MDKELQAQAWPWAMHLAGSILVLSIALKVIGVDFAPVMQALTASIARDIDRPPADCYQCSVSEFNYRLIEVERLAHESQAHKEGK